MKEMLYVVMFTFFRCRSFLPWYVAASISHFLTAPIKFSCYSSNEIGLLCFFISGSNFLRYPKEKDYDGCHSPFSYTPIDRYPASFSLRKKNVCMVSYSLPTTKEIIFIHTVAPTLRHYIGVNTHYPFLRPFFFLLLI